MQKKRKSEEELAKDGNVILFTALSMILLAFFIVLNSISVIDQNKKLEAWGSLLGSFGVLPGGVLLNKGDNLLPFESPIVEEGEMYEDTKRVMEKYLVEYQLIKDVGFTYEGRDMRISISSEFLFLPGKVALKPANLPFLNLVTRLVATVDNKVRVEGYSGKNESDQQSMNVWDFSLARSVRVMSHMVEKGNISAERFSVGAYGTDKQFNGKKEGLKKEGGRIHITLVGDVSLRKKEDEGLYRYKGFLFDFREGVSNGR